MKKIVFGKVIRYSILVSGVMAMSLGMNVTPAGAEVVAKFSPGGQSITLWAEYSTELLGSLEITFCDGTTDFFSLAPRHPLEWGAYTYIASKPMERVVISSVPNDGSGFADDGLPGKHTLFIRDCDNSLPSKPFCKNVNLSKQIHQGYAEPISFKSLRTMFSAYILIKGYDEVLITQRPAFYNNSQENEFTLRYKPSTGYWEGEFASMFLPVGEHEDVVLIVRDEFGQQGKCRVGDLTVLP